jgi:hypothetical protein
LRLNLRRFVPYGNRTDVELLATRSRLIRIIKWSIGFDIALTVLLIVSSPHLTLMAVLVGNATTLPAAVLIVFAVCEFVLTWCNVLFTVMERRLSCKWSILRLIAVCSSLSGVAFACWLTTQALY